MSQESTRDLTPVVPKRLRSTFFMLVGCLMIAAAACLFIHGFNHDFESFAIKAMGEDCFHHVTIAPVLLMALALCSAICLPLLASIIMIEFSFRAVRMTSISMMALAALLVAPAYLMASSTLYVSVLLLFGCSILLLGTCCNPNVLLIASPKTAIRRLNFAHCFTPFAGIICLLIFFAALPAALDRESPSINSQPINLALSTTDILLMSAPYALVFLFSLMLCKRVWCHKDVGDQLQDTASKRLWTIPVYLLCVTTATTLLVAFFLAAVEHSELIPPTLVRIARMMLGNVIFLFLVVCIAAMMLGNVIFLLLVGSYRRLLFALIRKPRFIFGSLSLMIVSALMAQVGMGLIKDIATVQSMRDPRFICLFLVMASLMLGRWLGTFLMKKHSPKKLLMIYSTGAILCGIAALCISSTPLYLGSFPMLDIINMLSCFCMGIMFPTIYADTMSGLTDTQMKLATSWLSFLILIGTMIIPTLFTSLQDSILPPCQQANMPMTNAPLLIGTLLVLLYALCMRRAKS